MSDYWYENKNSLRPEMMFITDSNEVVKLDRSVPGDATKWYVADITSRGWSYFDSTIEASELAYRIE